MAVYGEAVAVVMAGGQGERLWPLSKPDRPKQLLRLLSKDLNMLELSMARVAPLVGEENVYVSTSAKLEPAILASGALPTERVIAEPDRRDTLGALVWTVARLVADGHDGAAVAVLTADHHIGDEDAFRADVAAALELARREGAIVTMGITPDRAEIGYGYIETDRETRLDASNGVAAYASKGFKEKPDAETAAGYVAAGNFLWNSGMFFFTVETFRRELAAADPAASDVLDRIATAMGLGDLGAAADAFRELRKVSVDYAVMEKASRILTVPSTFAWDDLGSWDAVARMAPGDADGNVTRGQAVVKDSRGTLVFNDHPVIQVAVLGLEDVAIVLDDSGLLVCRRSEAGRLKELLAELPG